MIFLAILSWVIVGSVIGFIASRAVDLRGDDSRIGIGLSVAGAVCGGVVHRFVTAVPLSFLDGWNLLFASIGALIVATVWHMIRRRAPYSRQSVRRSY